LEFTSDKAAEFRKFTQQHLKQTVQILVGTNVVATPIIQSVIPSKKIYLNFQTREEATRISDYLMTK
jgi:preprotein translocase subunit SecD